VEKTRSPTCTSGQSQREEGEEGLLDQTQRRLREQLWQDKQAHLEHHAHLEELEQKDFRTSGTHARPRTHIHLCTDGATSRAKNISQQASSSFMACKRAL
jgi:hypothetical protein